MPDPSVMPEATAAPSVLVAGAVSANGAVAGSVTSNGGSRRLGLGVFLVILVVGIALLIAFFSAVQHWLALYTGTLHGGPDLYYNFWSGFGSDLGEATLISAVGVGVYAGVRKVNCHSKGCWRIGHHPLEGTPYILCRHHHPDVPRNGASHEHILEQHRKYKEAKAAMEHLGSH
jgi:hypothetical protein